MRLLNFDLSAEPDATSIVGLGRTWDLQGGVSLRGLEFLPLSSEARLSWIGAPGAPDPAGCVLVFRRLRYVYLIGAHPLDSEAATSIQAINWVSVQEGATAFDPGAAGGERFCLRFDFVSGLELEIACDEVELLAGDVNARDGAAS